MNDHLRKLAEAAIDSLRESESRPSDIGLASDAARAVARFHAAANPATILRLLDALTYARRQLASSPGAVAEMERILGT